MRILIRAVVLVAILSALASSGVRAQRNVDTIVTNGKILTVDDRFSIVEALAIDEGRIVTRGTRQEVARYAGPKTQVIDVGGKTVIPVCSANSLASAFQSGHAAWRARRYSWCSPARIGVAITSVCSGRRCPVDMSLVRSGNGSGIPGPRLACGRPRL
jgi:hypothetical protein